MVADWNEFVILDSEESVSDTWLVYGSIRFYDQLVLWMWQVECVPAECAISLL